MRRMKLSLSSPLKSDEDERNNSLLAGRINRCIDLSRSNFPPPSSSSAFSCLLESRRPVTLARVLLEASRKDIILYTKDDLATSPRIPRTFLSSSSSSSSPPSPFLRTWVKGRRSPNFRSTVLPDLQRYNPCFSKFEFEKGEKKRKREYFREFGIRIRRGY